MARPTRQQVRDLLKTSTTRISGAPSYNAETALDAEVTKFFTLFEESLEEAEAPTLRRQLKKAIELKVELEAQLLEANARGDQLLKEMQPPITIGAGGFHMIEDRNELDFSQLARGVPFILLDQPVPPPTVAEQKLAAKIVLGGKVSEVGYHDEADPLSDPIDRKKR